MPLRNYMIAHKENKYFHPQKHIAHSIKISRGFWFWCNASMNCTCAQCHGVVYHASITIEHSCVRTTDGFACNDELECLRLCYGTFKPIKFVLNPYHHILEKQRFATYAIQAETFLCQSSSILLIFFSISYSVPCRYNSIIFFQTSLQ